LIKELDIDNSLGNPIYMEKEISKAISKLKSNKSPGLDNIF
jgi:hypothetical protein